jgi:hypothetical protein
METLNAMLQDLVFQARRLQASTSAGQRQQTVIDLFGPHHHAEFTGVAGTRSKIVSSLPAGLPEAFALHTWFCSRSAQEAAVL